MTAVINYLFVFLVIIIGLATSWEDIKFGKIRNKWILLGLAGGIALQAAALAGGFLPTDLIFSGLLNALIALLVGYLLWYFDLWAAGDAKLFFVFALLLPLSYYSRTYLPFFPSFALLVNTFVPVLLFLLAQSIFFLFKKFFISNDSKISKKNFSIIAIRQKLLGVKDNLWRNRVKYAKVTIGFLLILIVYFIFKNWFLGKAKIGFFALISGSMLFFVVFGLARSIISFYIKSVDKKHLHFAFWLFLGAILTLLFQGSLLSLIY